MTGITREQQARAIHPPATPLIGDRVCVNCGRPLFQHSADLIPRCPAGSVLLGQAAPRVDVELR